MFNSSLSDAKLTANRANARRSTGPRTPRGKAIAAANGLRHGLFARDLLLNGESGDELLELKAAMIKRLNPRDPLELELVGRVVEACWKIRRLQRFERMIYQRECERCEQAGYALREANGLGHRQAVPAEVAWQNGGEPFQQQIDRIETLRHRLENGLHRALRQLDKLREQESDPAPNWFAEDALASERRQHQNWQCEATAASTSADAAQLADASAKREQSRINREADACAEQFANEPDLCDAAQPSRVDADNVAADETDDEASPPQPPPNGQLEATGEAPGQSQSRAEKEWTASHSQNWQGEATITSDLGLTVFPQPVRGERAGELCTKSPATCSSSSQYPAEKGSSKMSDA